MTGRAALRGAKATTAVRVMHLKRGERPCPVSHDTPEIRAGAPCSRCGAAK